MGQNELDVMNNFQKNNVFDECNNLLKINELK